jgi:peptidoglycan lytic transglycosylase B
VPPDVYNSIVRALVLALALITTQSNSERPAFSDWLKGVREEALTRGIREEVVDEALGHLDEPLPIVIERDRAQAEIVLPIESYISRLLTPKRIRHGREVYTAERDLLDRVSSQYGVPGRIIAAIWGVESNFGQFSGVRPTIGALATLAWDPRRSSFFRGELLDALEILNRGDIGLDSMKGSWAGAMGQVQFMPSSYLKYAEDFDGDGRRDIWATTGDVLASIANYLKGHGWSPAQSWGREVTVSKEAARTIIRDVARREGTCRATRDMTVALPMKQWRALGVKLAGGKQLPATDATASLVSGSKRHFLVSTNYDALLDYNCAHSYALSVALLGDALASSGAPPKGAAPAKSARKKHAA